MSNLFKNSNYWLLISTIILSFMNFKIILMSMLLSLNTKNPFALLFVLSVTPSAIGVGCRNMICAIVLSVQYLCASLFVGVKDAMFVNFFVMTVVSILVAYLIKSYKIKTGTQIKTKREIFAAMLLNLFLMFFLCLMPIGYFSTYPLIMTAFWLLLTFGLYQRSQICLIVSVVIWIIYAYYFSIMLYNEFSIYSFGFIPLYVVSPLYIYWQMYSVNLHNKC